MASAQRRLSLEFFSEPRNRKKGWYKGRKKKTATTTIVWKAQEKHCSIPYPIPESSNSDASLTQGKTLCFRVENGKIVSPPSGGENLEGTTLDPKWLREINDVRVPRLPMPSERPPEFCDWILALDEKSQKALHTSIQKYSVLLRKEFWSDREERFDLTLLERVVGSRAREALVETEWHGFVARLTWDEANELQTWMKLLRWMSFGH